MSPKKIACSYVYYWTISLRGRMALIVYRRPKQFDHRLSSKKWRQEKSIGRLIFINFSNQVLEHHPKSIWWFHRNSFSPNLTPIWRCSRAAEPTLRTEALFKQREKRREYEEMGETVDSDD